MWRAETPVTDITAPPLDLWLCSLWFLLEKAVQISREIRPQCSIAAWEVELSFSDNRVCVCVCLCIYVCVCACVNMHCVRDRVLLCEILSTFLQNKQTSASFQNEIHSRLYIYLKEFMSFHCSLEWSANYYKWCIF